MHTYIGFRVWNCALVFFEKHIHNLLVSMSRFFQRFAVASPFNQVLTTASVRLHLRKRRNGPLGVANSGWFFGPALKGNHGFSRLKKAGVVRWGVNGWAVMKKKTPRETRIRKKFKDMRAIKSPPDCYGLLVMKFRSFFFCGTRWDEAIRTVMRVAKLDRNLRGPPPLCQPPQGIKPYYGVMKPIIVP